MFTLTFPHLMFSSSFVYHLLPILQDCTVYETENKILHVVSFCFKMSDLYLNINCNSTHPSFSGHITHKLAKHYVQYYIGIDLLCKVPYHNFRKKSNKVLGILEEKLIFATLIRHYFARSLMRSSMPYCH